MPPAIHPDAYANCAAAAAAAARHNIHQQQHHPQQFAVGGAHVQPRQTAATQQRSSTSFAVSPSAQISVPAVHGRQFPCSTFISESSGSSFSPASLPQQMPPPPAPRPAELRYSSAVHVNQDSSASDGMSPCTSSRSAPSQPTATSVVSLGGDENGNGVNRLNKMRFRFTRKVTVYARHGSVLTKSSGSE